MYTLDFDTMKMVMQEHQKTGLLTADLPAGSAGMQEPGRIEIKFEAGKMISCAIVGESGRRFTEKEAAKRISRLGSLFWTFVPLAAAQPEQQNPGTDSTNGFPPVSTALQSPNSRRSTSANLLPPSTSPIPSFSQMSPTTPVPSEFSPAYNFAGGNMLYPRRTIQLDQNQTRNWPRIHRQIFALADGTRNIAKIAEMLSAPIDQISRAMRDLQQIGAIVMGPQIGRVSIPDCQLSARSSVPVVPDSQRARWQMG
jgi:hypothetical protein